MRLLFTGFKPTKQKTNQVTIDCSGRTNFKKEIECDYFL
jgi:hypothetical protein